MLNRQKSLLYMMEQAGRPVTRLEMTKWAFLLAHEMPSQGGSAFYQFLPYQRGPFSFCLYRETDRLVRDGYLAAGDTTWRIVTDVKRPTDRLPQPVREDAARVVQRFADKTQDSLTDYVYQRFPWYTVNSLRRRLSPRPIASIAVFTVGYEGWLIDGFLDLLMRAGIQRVVDVRSNPISRRYGFHKRTLDRLCGKLQIEYVHFPQLGVPSKQRQELDAAEGYKALFDRYEADVLSREKGAISQVASLVQERPTALMCMEADPLMCHRSRLAKAVALATALPLRHLGERDATGV